MEKRVLHDMIDEMPMEKLNVIYDFISFIKSRPTALDEVDYALANMAKEDKEKEYISFDDTLKVLGFSKDDLS